MNECNLYVYTKSVLSDLSCRLNVFEPHIHAHSIWKSDDGIASKHIFSDLHVLPRNALASSETKKKETQNYDIKISYHLLDACIKKRKKNKNLVELNVQ